MSYLLAGNAYLQRAVVQLKQRIQELEARLAEDGSSGMPRSGGDPI